MNSRRLSRLRDADRHHLVDRGDRLSLSVNARRLSSSPHTLGVSFDERAAPDGGDGVRRIEPVLRKSRDFFCSVGHVDQALHTFHLGDRGFGCFLAKPGDE